MTRRFVEAVRTGLFGVGLLVLLAVGIGVGLMVAAFYVTSGVLWALRSQGLVP